MGEKGRIFKNTIIYAIRQIMAVLFPLITFAYVSRVLGVEKIGVVNYAHSITTYFVILSGLGISTYAIRVGAQKRDNEEEINQFVSEVFTINLISTIISLLVYLVIVFSFDSLKSYRSMLIAFSLLIPFTTLGIEWVYNIYEDFLYITVRSIVFQFLSLILLFTFVRSAEDAFVYACITVFATVGSNVLNFIHSRKYIKLNSLALSSRLKHHIQPVILLFGMTIATTLYTNMDTTMLGAMCGDYQVGLYSAAHRITKIIVQTLAVVRTVSLPALARHTKDHDEDEAFIELGSGVLGAILLVSIPIAVAVACTADVILTIFSGAAFLEAAPTLRLLAVDILLSVLSGTLIYQYVLLKKGEKSAFWITASGAIANLVMNYIFIRAFASSGAALATCISELIVSFLAFSISKQYMNLKSVIRQILLGGLGSIIIIAFTFAARIVFGNAIIPILASLILAGITFAGVLIKLKNNCVYEVITSYMNKRR